MCQDLGELIRNSLWPLVSGTACAKCGVGRVGARGAGLNMCCDLHGQLVADGMGQGKEQCERNVTWLRESVHAASVHSPAAVLTAPSLAHVALAAGGQGVPVPVCAGQAAPLAGSTCAGPRPQVSQGTQLRLSDGLQPTTLQCIMQVSS